MQFGNIYGRKHRVKMEMQFIFASCPAMFKSTVLFGIAVKKFYPETRAVTGYRFCSVDFKVSREVEFSRHFFTVTVVKNRYREIDVSPECFTIDGCIVNF
jgi:hypothetical protein